MLRDALKNGNLLFLMNINYRKCVIIYKMLPFYVSFNIFKIKRRKKCSLEKDGYIFFYFMVTFLGNYVTL